MQLLLRVNLALRMRELLHLCRILGLGLVLQQLRVHVHLEALLLWRLLLLHLVNLLQLLLLLLIKEKLL